MITFYSKKCFQVLILRLFKSQQFLFRLTVSDYYSIPPSFITEPLRTCKSTLPSILPSSAIFPHPNLTLLLVSLFWCRALHRSIPCQVHQWTQNKCQCNNIKMKEKNIPATQDVSCLEPLQLLLPSSLLLLLLPLCWFNVLSRSKIN